MGIPYNCYLLDKKGKATPDLSKGDLYISVSSVLKMEGKDLVPWALKTFGSASEPLKAHRAYMEKVSDLGSRIHAYVENDLKGTPLADSDIQDDMLPAIVSWQDFKALHTIELLGSERTVFSKKWRCAGTCDLICKIDGELSVADFKTGSVYPSAFTQMAAYHSFLCQEKGKKRIPEIEKAQLLVINLHREGKPVELHTLNSYYQGRVSVADELGVFHCLRYLWWHRNIKSKKFEPIIKNMKEILNPLNERFQETFQKQFNRGE